MVEYVLIVLLYGHNPGPAEKGAGWHMLPQVSTAGIYTADTQSAAFLLCQTALGDVGQNLDGNGVTAQLFCERSK